MLGSWLVQQSWFVSHLAVGYNWRTMRTTKLSVFCDYVIEAGWLAAVITVPLFFNVYSSRVFEPDKLTLLRSIALFMALAWLVKVLDTGLTTSVPARDNTHPASRIPHPASRILHLIRATPLVLPTLLLVAVYLLSTGTSVAPRLSFWGSYQRLQGTYTTLAYIIIFLLILQGLRTREQLDRLITAIILTSLPVALYGLIQHYGLDPLPWLGDVTTRVASSMGNSIFVAAYLIMVIPLTMMRLLEGFASLVQAEDDLAPPFIQATGYLFIFLAQMLAIFFSQSRGPWLGFLSAMFVFGLLWAVTRGSRRLITGIISLALLAGAFLVALNLPNTPLDPIKEMPYVGRLGRVFETESGTGKVRVLIWEGATKLIVADPVRTLIGYGPETMHVAYNPYYPPDLAHYEARNASPDRSHNETFDALVITGLVGFAAYLLLFITLFYYGLKWLGLVEGPGQRNLLVGLIMAGGILSALGFRLANGTNRFFGVALPAGMIVGLFAYLVWSTLSGRQQETTDAPFPLMLIMLLAAVIGHFVEIHFGIAIAATRTLFWTYAALMVVVGYLVYDRPELITGLASQPALAPVRSSRRSRRGRRYPDAGVSEQTTGWPWESAIPVAGISSVILITIVYDYITNPARESAVMSVVFHTLLSRWKDNHFVTSPSILWLVSLVWLLTGFLGLAMAASRPSSGRSSLGWWARAFAIYSGVTLTIFLGFSLLVAARLTPLPSTVTLDQAVGTVANHITLYYVALFSTLFALAIAMAWTRAVSGGLWSGRWPVLLSPFLAVIAFLVISNTNLDVVKADIMYKQAWNGYHQRGQFDPAIATYRKALSLQPNEDYYYLFLGKAYLEKVRTINDPAERERLFEASRQVLEKARRLNPLNPDHTANLARLHQQWAQMTGDPSKREEYFETALRYHQQATDLAPNAAHLYNEWALTLDQMGQYDEALEKLQKSLSLDAEFVDTYVFLGEVYRHNTQFDEAIAAYQEALKLKPDRTDANRGLALLYAYQGDLDNAIEQELAVIERSPNDRQAHQHLAILYQQQGQLDAAQREAETAIQLDMNDPASYLVLGDIFRMGGQTEQAIEVYQQALSLDPQATEAYGGLALAYESLGDLNTALDYARQALNLAPDNAQLQAFVQQLENRRQ
ncbi:MAG: tetratricopeptide repeat protein [Anaerolineae bacterium]